MVLIGKVNNYMFQPIAAKEVHTPPFIDPLDIPLDKLSCST